MSVAGRHLNRSGFLCGCVQSSVDKSIAEMMAYKFGPYIALYAQCIYRHVSLNLISDVVVAYSARWCVLHSLYLFLSSFFELKSQREGAAHYQQIELPVFSPTSFFCVVVYFTFFSLLQNFLFLRCQVPVRDDIGDDPSSWKDMYPFSDYLSI